MMKIRCIPALENIKNSLLVLQQDSAYENYRNRVSDQKPLAMVKTDKTGNTITEEKIELLTFAEYTADFLDSQSLVLKSEARSLKINAFSFQVGDVYDSNYASFGKSPLITRDLPTKSYPSLDVLDTKNIIEE